MDDRFEIYRQRPGEETELIATAATREAALFALEVLTEEGEFEGAEAIMLDYGPEPEAAGAMRQILGIQL